MIEFTTWDDMTELDKAHSAFWDMYKEAYGVRPRGIDTSSWTMDEFNSTFDSLAATIKANDEERDAQEAKAIAEYESTLNSLVKNNGAKNTETAQRWLMEASECNGDWDYFAYCNGLPYGFFRK